MLSRVILAFACGAVLCLAQSESTPSPSPSTGSAAAKEIGAQAPADVPGTSVATAAQQGPKAQPSSGPPATNASAVESRPPTATPPVTPPIDVPPQRKKDAASSPEIIAPGAKPAGKNNKQATAKPEPGQTPYVIGRLDVLIIKVWGQANLSGPVDVGVDGKISLPLIGEVKAEGLTKEELKADLTKGLSDFLNNPEVDVQIGKINSKSYFVYGGAGRPGEFPLVKPTTVMDAVSTFGGFREFANTKKIRIQRILPSGQTQEFQFNYKDVSRGKHMEQNIYLQNGDRIFVPE